MLTEMLSLKLSVFGWSLVLVWLSWKRYQELRTGHPNTATIRVLHGDMLVIFTSILALVNVVQYFLPLIDNIVFGDYTTRHPLTLMVAMVGELICISIAIDRLAYSRTYKLHWEAGWFLFVHIMVWGRAWTTG